MAVEQIRIVRVQGRAEGMEVVQSALDKVAGATVRVTQAADGMSVATEAQTRKVLSLSKQWETYQARTDLAARAQQQFARDISSVTRFYEQGTIGASRYADEVERVKNSLTAAGTVGLPKVDQSGLNSLLGVKSPANNQAKESASAFTAEISRLDTIRAKYDPVFAAQEKYRNAVEAISEAERLGAISGNLAADARLKEANSLNSQIANFERLASVQKQSVQASVNRQTVVPDRASDVAAYGTQLDALRAKYNPLFAAQREYVSSLNEIRMAQKTGAISSSEMAAAIESTKVSFVSLVRDLNGVAAAEQRAAQTAKQLASEQSAAARLAAEAQKTAADQAAAAQQKQAAAAADLRAQINPLGAEFARLGKQMAEYRGLMNAGLISSTEFGQAQVMAGKRLSDFEKNLKNGANAGRVMSGELVNLSYQLNDVVTGLALGQSPFMILGQQGGQVFQIFQNSKASVVDFAKEAGSKLLSFVTVGRLAFTGVALAVGGATLALNSYLNAQNKVALGLAGAGRASGASLSGINKTAEAGSSLTGFSVSEARELATALAATGKVANDNILPIVRMGKDIATAFGTDAAGATELLAKTFADPIRGAEELNARLGFMDASMQRQIQSLVAQNRLWDAQKMLTAGVQSSLADVNAAVGTSTKFWTALGNVISNAWEKFGEGAARATGIGLKLGMDEQIENARKRVAELEAIMARRSEAVNKNAGTTALRDTEKAKLDDLTAAYSRYGQAAVEAQQRQFSFAQAAGVRMQIPAIDQIEKLRNEQELLVRTMVDVQATGGPASEILKRMGQSYEQLAAALAIANGNMKSFKNEFQTSSDALKIANDSITAFSPSAKGDIARRSSIESTINSKMTPEQKAVLAEQAYSNAVKQSTTALSEAARQRKLTAEQSVASTQLEIDMVGKSIGQQVEMRANLQARQQLEAEASQNRTRFDDAQYARLQKINAELGRKAQLAALENVRNDIRFGAATALLSPDDVAIASQLKQVYPDVATALNSVEAAGLRTNSALSGLSSSLSGTLTTGLADIVDGTKSISTGAADMSKAFIRAIEEMIIKIAIITPLMRAFQIAAGSLGGGLMGGGSPSGYGGGGGMLASANGNGFSGSNVIPFARGGAFTNGIYDSPTFFKFASGGAMASGVMAEAGPEAVVPLVRGTNGKLGVASSGGGGDRTPRIIIINETGTQATAETSTSPEGDMTIRLKKMVESIGIESIANGEMGRTISQKFAVKQFAGG